MSYQVIARKYRPQTFDQIVGQNHITQTLNNALKNNRIPHALLFTGPRGTGKTSSARILAKALRCPNAVNFVPCDHCESCLEISQGRSVDVIEIDGASNNGVDAIRDLRENVMFMPSTGKYKIIIIDEVHMLSTSAFNALLKTLEEPPSHVIFILATTEVHKIPQTILSRCQRFDFRRIQLKEIAAHLLTVCKQENVQAEMSALWLIARQGDGSMRDSLSLLDQVISFTNGHLTESEVSSVLGLTERSLVYEVFQSLLNRKPEQTVQTLQKLIQSGQNPSLFLEDLAKLIRHCLILKTDPGARAMIDLPDDEIDQLIERISTTTYADLHMLFDMTLKGLQDVSRAQDAEIVFEISLLRMAQAPSLMDLRNFLTGLPLAPTNKTAQPQISSRPQMQPQTQPAVIQKMVDIDEWLQFVESIKKTDALFASKIENLIFVQVIDKKITLQPPAQFSFLTEQIQNPEIKLKLQGLIDSHWGKGYTFEVLKSSKSMGKTSTVQGQAANAKPVGETAQSLALKKQAAAAEELKEKWMQDPRVQKAQEVFKGEVRLTKTNNSNF